MVSADIARVGQNDIIRLCDRNLDKLFHRLKGGQVCLNQVTAKDARNAEGVVKSRADHKINANRLGDFNGLLMAGVALQD